MRSSLEWVNVLHISPMAGQELREKGKSTGPGDRQRLRGAHGCACKRDVAVRDWNVWRVGVSPCRVVVDHAPIAGFDEQHATTCVAGFRQRRVAIMCRPPVTVSGVEGCWCRS